MKAYTKLYHHIKLRSITNEIDIKSSPEDVLSHWIYGSPYLPYYGSSSGYLMLLNAFTRRKKVINTSTFWVNFYYFAYHVFLAFGKGREEFVLLALCKCFGSLNVYQYRISDWVTYLTGKVVDFVVLHDTIYVICCHWQDRHRCTGLEFRKYKFFVIEKYSCCNIFLTHKVGYLWWTTHNDSYHVWGNIECVQHKLLNKKKS